MEEQTFVKIRKIVSIAVLLVLALTIIATTANPTVGAYGVIGARDPITGCTAFEHLVYRPGVGFYCVRDYIPPLPEGHCTGLAPSCPRGYRAMCEDGRWVCENVMN